MALREIIEKLSAVDQYRLKEFFRSSQGIRND